MVTFFSGPNGADQRIDEYATGTSGFHGAEGTWRDAEDGHLQGNAIAQGAVDSTLSHHVAIDAHGEQSVYMVMIAGHSRDELIELHRWLLKIGPQGVIDRTTSYWRLWVGGTNINFGNLPPKVIELFKRSLLLVRTQIDNDGAICAANDSDIMQFSRNTYSYVWPRDGALVADSLDLAGFPDVARSFYTFCQKAITPEGFLYHKYNPDGSPASSWHPWVHQGPAALPIQEDETALVVWASGGITTAIATSNSSARSGSTSCRRRPTSCAAIATRVPGCRCRATTCGKNAGACTRSLSRRCMAG